MKTGLLKVGLILSIVMALLILLLSIFLITFSDEIVESLYAGKSTIYSRRDVTSFYITLLPSIIIGIQFIIVIGSIIFFVKMDNLLRSDVWAREFYSFGILCLLFTGIIPGLLILIGIAQIRKLYQKEQYHNEHQSNYHHHPRRDYDDRGPRRDYDDRRPSRIEYYDDEEPRARRSDRWER